MSKQSTMSRSATLHVPEDLEDSVLFSAPPTPMPNPTFEIEPLGPRTRLRSATDRSSKYRIPARRYDSTVSDMSTQFDRKYPPDLYGQEASDNARVWQVYCDESGEHDMAMLEGWNKTLDILLIFAGLFSAVSTAFIIEAYRALQPDYTAYTANLLYLVATASQSNSTAVPVLPHPEAFVISDSDRWTNGLWFMSLVLSLSVALLSILAKQWLDEYRARITGPFQSARYWARRRALFFKGMKAWHLPAFISTLPVLLHISLFLFLAGLVLFLWALDTAIACCVLALSGLILGFYCISVVLPLWQPDCPTRIPLVDQLPRLWARTKSIWRVPASRALTLATFVMERIPKLNFAQLSDSVRSLNEKVQTAPPMSNTEAQERKLVDERMAALDASALRWLLRSSPAQDVIAVGVQAIGALPPWSETLNHLRLTEVPNLVRDHVELSFPKVSTVGSFINTEADAARCARYLRSWISIRIERGVYTDSQLLARIVRHPMPNSHDLPLLRFIIRWTLDHYVDSTSFMAVLKVRNTKVQQSERDGWVFLPSTVLQSITLVVEHKSNRMHRALSAVLHLFHAGRLWEEPEEDLMYAASQVGALLTAMGDRYVDTSLLSGLEACIDFWSMILNGSAFYQLDDDDMHVAARDLGLLVARHETVRKATVLVESVPAQEIERSHDFAAFVASPSFLQHGWDLRVLEAMAHSIQRVATLGLSVGHTARALSHLTLAFTRHKPSTPEGRAEYDEIMTSFQDIVSAMFTELAFPLRAASDTRHAHSEKHPLLPSAIASATQETLLYFLRRHNDEPSAWHVLHHAGWTAMSRLIVADALAANLCTMSRRGRDGNELLRLIDEFFSVEFITRDSMSKARSLGTSLQDSVDSFDYNDNYHVSIAMFGENDEYEYGTQGRRSDDRSHVPDPPMPMMPEVVRLAQHCGELRHKWWVRACERILAEIEMEVDDPDPQLRDFVQQLLQMADQPCETC